MEDRRLLGAMVVVRGVLWGRGLVLDALRGMRPMVGLPSVSASLSLRDRDGLKKCGCWCFGCCGCCDEEFRRFRKEKNFRLLLRPTFPMLLAIQKGEADRGGRSEDEITGDSLGVGVEGGTTPVEEDGVITKTPSLLSASEMGEGSVVAVEVGDCSGPAAAVFWERDVSGCCSSPPELDLRRRNKCLLFRLRLLFCAAKEDDAAEEEQAEERSVSLSRAVAS